MKRIFLIIAAVFAVTVAANAQKVVANYDFEDGTVQGWGCWKKEHQPIVKEGAKSGQYAYSVQRGSFFNVDVEEGGKYAITASTYNKWGNASGVFSISYYDNSVGKFVESEMIDLPLKKGFSDFEYSFKGKATGKCRLIFKVKQGGYIVDDVKIVKLK